MFAAAPMANAYQKIIETQAIASSVAGSQDAINYFMQHLVKFILGTSLISLVIALAKPESVQTNYWSYQNWILLQRITYICTKRSRENLSAEMFFSLWTERRPTGCCFAD